MLEARMRKKKYAKGQDSDSYFSFPKATLLTTVSPSDSFPLLLRAKHVVTTKAHNDFCCNKSLKLQLRNEISKNERKEP